MATKTELLQEREWRRCRGQDIGDVEAFIHWAERHVKIQHPSQGAAPFTLRPAQKEIISTWMEERYSIVLKARQIGWSTLAAVYCLWLAVFYSDQMIVMLSRNQREARKLLGKADYAWKRLPKWMRARAPRRITENKDDISFDNGSKVESLPSKEDPARGSAVSLIIVDEWAFFDDAEQAWAAIQPVADVGGRVIGLSTANGWGDFFHTMWVKATTGVSDFKPMFFPWSANDDRDENWYESQKANLPEWQLWQEYPSTEDEAFIKSGRPVFNVDALAAMGIEVPRRGVLQNLGVGLSFLEQKGGDLRVWELPRSDEKYVIGADVAEGLEHGDYSSAHVLASKGQKVVAVWHGHVDPDLFGDILVDLGNYYGRALVAVEVNNHGLTTNKALQRARYPRIYYRRSLDQRTRQQRLQVGWRTDVASKPLMIDGLAALLRGGYDCRDSETIAELRTFVRDEKGRMSGSPFDDRVISFAIAGEMLNHVHDAYYAPPQSGGFDILKSPLDDIVAWDQAKDRALELVPIGSHNVRPRT